ncbi:MAG: chemotaxis protein CheW [Candidatus Binatia bacterium]
MSEADEMEEVVTEFLVESYENLDQLDRDLVALEKEPGSREILASVFRTIHTIKGTCGFLGFGKLEAVAHVGESLLALLRDGKLALDAERTSALLAMVDAVRQMLASIEATRAEGERDDAALIARLVELQQVDAPAAVPVEPAEPAPVVERVAQVASPVSAPPAESGGPVAGGMVSDTNIRVDVSLLDRLMTLAGELVLARNQILQYSAAQADTTFLAASQRLNLITTELQEGVMKTRMQPIGNIWSKFPRVVRDLAVACGRKVALELEGAETELDKTIIEAIKDPLTHLVRNAVDHGIEPPDARRAAGKPAEGRLLLRAFHEGGQVNIEICDDGAGIDPENIRRKALERGLITPEQAARLSDREVTRLLFLPGFSTAEKVTNVSGRGVGMDVVKTNIEKIGGSVDVFSTPGEGTRFRIKIPLTLAIIPALIVTCRAERYAIPQVNLVELVRVEAKERAQQIEHINGAPVHRLRGHLLPLVHLDRELGLGAAESGDNARADDAVNIVVLQTGDCLFGLVVDEVNDTEEIVVKPLSNLLKGIPAFAGATIMGDGRVALILDVVGLAQGAHVVHEASERGAVAGGSEDGTAGERQSLLLVTVGESGRLAVPLGLVGRLEEFARTAVERVGAREVVQYRGEIMPLLRLGDVLGEAHAAGGETLQVVVYAAGRCHVGLVVDRIVDIVEEVIVVQGHGTRPGVVGSAVIQQRVTDLLDVPELIRAVDPTVLDTPAEPSGLGAEG